MLASDPAHSLDQILGRAGTPTHAGVNLKRSCSNGTGTYAHREAAGSLSRQSSNTTACRAGTSAIANVSK